MSDDPVHRARMVLDAWSRGILERDIPALTSLFAPDVLFVATAPAPLRGQDAVAAYYASAPSGLVPSADLIDVARDGPCLTVVAAVAFDVPGSGRRSGVLTLAIRPGEDGRDRIVLYHAALSG